MPTFFEKLALAWALMRSHAFVLATDKSAVVYIKLNNPESFKSVMLLGSQQAALEELKLQLERAIEDHEKQVELLLNKEK